MNYERSILISFLGNYLTNNVIAAIVALIPISATAAVITPQYITYVVLAAVLVAVLTWWVGAHGLTAGAIFGVIGFAVALVTAFVTGISGVLTQTGSIAQAGTIIPEFWPFLASWSTLVLLGYWVIPAAIVGWFMGRGSSSTAM
ncbi:MAG TPA: hypothetical protein VJH91_02290 [Candidatus Paceibacterota bacterium]